MLGLGAFEAKVCDCGFHESLTGDKANHFGFEVRTCLVCRGGAKFARIQADTDEQEEKALRGNPRASRSADGRRVFTKLMSTEEAKVLATAPGPRRAAGAAPDEGAPRPQRPGSARRRALAGHRRP